MDKKEFRRLYKELYFSNKSTSGDPVGPNVLTDHDLEKLSDRVFQAFDGDGTGRLIALKSFAFILTLLFSGKLTFEGTRLIIYRSTTFPCLPF